MEGGSPPEGGASPHPRSSSPPWAVWEPREERVPPVEVETEEERVFRPVGGWLGQAPACGGGALPALGLGGALPVLAWPGGGHRVGGGGGADPSSPDPPERELDTLLPRSLSLPSSGTWSSNPPPSIAGGGRGWAGRGVGQTPPLGAAPCPLDMGAGCDGAMAPASPVAGGAPFTRALPSVVGGADARAERGWGAAWASGRRRSMGPDESRAMLPRIGGRRPPPPPPPPPWPRSRIALAKDCPAAATAAPKLVPCCKLCMDWGWAEWRRGGAWLPPCTSTSTAEDRRRWWEGCRGTDALVMESRPAPPPATRMEWARAAAPERSSSAMDDVGGGGCAPLGGGVGWPHEPRLRSCQACTPPGGPACHSRGGCSAGSWPAVHMALPRRWSMVESTEKA